MFHKARSLLGGYHNPLADQSRFQYKGFRVLLPPVAELSPFTRFQEIEENTSFGFKEGVLNMVNRVKITYLYFDS